MTQKLPSAQEMDKKYDRYYLVPYHDCQKFDDCDGSDIWTIPTYYEGEPVTFVDREWVKANYENGF